MAELTAYRVWELCYDESGPALRSWAIPVIWRGPVMRAHVRPSVYWWTLSGLHAYKDKQLVEEDGPRIGMGWLYGTVGLWGHVVEHELGWRAEKAIVRSIVVPWAKAKPKACLGWLMHLLHRGRLVRVANYWEDDVATAMNPLGTSRAFDGFRSYGKADFRLLCEELGARYQCKVSERALDYRA